MKKITISKGTDSQTFPCCNSRVEAAHKELAAKYAGCDVSISIDDAGDFLILQRTPGRPSGGYVVYFEVPGRDDWPMEINIYAKNNFGTLTITEFEVNWSALGSVDAKTAHIFAQALTIAAQEANRLNLTYSGSKISP